MANTIRWTIQPKTIDTNSNELNLEQYTVENTYTQTLTHTIIIPAATTTPQTLPVITAHVAIELISNQPVSFTVTDGAEVPIFLTSKNCLMSFSTSKAYTYTVTNASGFDATITWRLYV